MIWKKVNLIKPMTNIQSFNGSTVEWVEEGGEAVPLLGGVLLLLLEGEGVEEEVRGESHDQVLLWAQTERPGRNVFSPKKCNCETQPSSIHSLAL